MINTYYRSKINKRTAQLQERIFLPRKKFLGKPLHRCKVFIFLISIKVNQNNKKLYKHNQETALFDFAIFCFILLLKAILGISDTCSSVNGLSSQSSFSAWSISSSILAPSFSNSAILFFLCCLSLVMKQKKTNYFLVLGFLALDTFFTTKFPFSSTSASLTLYFFINLSF